jgi:nitroreductase
VTDTRTLLAARFGVPLSPHGILDDPVLARMLGRRTHRQYRSETVERDLIRSLLHVAFAAPSKSDFQQANVIFVEDHGRRAEIADLVPSMPWVRSAPVFLVFCPDADRLRRISEARNRPTPNDNLEAFFNATVDAALLMQTFMIAAEHVGLGCCPISAIRDHLPSVARVLELPERVFPVAGLCVGYPAREGQVSMRLPPKLTAHIDRYCDEILDQQIADYDHRRSVVSKSGQPPPPAGAVTHAWSDNKARQAVAGEGSAFGAMVRAHGFALD